MKNGIPFCRGILACAGAAIAFSGVASTALADDCPAYDILFSLDIGSDTELSDPLVDFDEVFDPGDAYIWTMAPAIPANGFIDDSMFFIVDPPPDPFVVGTAALTCSGFPVSDLVDQWYDMDGLDIIDFQLDLQPGFPLTSPLPCPGSPCIGPPEKLFLSWDDDAADHYSGSALVPCPVPVASPSPFIGGLFGTTVGKDEVFSITVTPTVPTPVGPFVSELDEVMLNASLGPNPDLTEADDDDCDALDLLMAPAVGQTICRFAYMSPDHEAAFGLDPGDIYGTDIFGAGGLFFAIDDVTHLGIPDSTDVDAFEFVCAEFPDGPVGGPLFLALLFSVDDDDPLTPGDESGGLAPDVIYISYFMGFSVPFTPPLGEDIDAIANWCVHTAVGGACCFCDGTCIDSMTAADCALAGGTYMGDGSVCAAVTCVELGACCFCDGTCIDGISLVSCEGLGTGAIWQGPCTDCTTVQCEETGACCFCDGTCVEVTLAACTALSGTWTAPCVSCEFNICIKTGACCLPSGVCIETDSITCTNSGGVYQGDCIDCANVICPVGVACCFGCDTYPGGPSFICVDMPSIADCCAAQGLHLGPGSSCAGASCTAMLCPADMNGDNMVNAFDFAILAPNFGSCVPLIFGRCDGDLDCDGCVTAFDFAIFAPNFGCSLPPIPSQCCGP